MQESHPPTQQIYHCAKTYFTSSLFILQVGNSVGVCVASAVYGNEPLRRFCCFDRKALGGGLGFAPYGLHC